MKGKLILLVAAVLTLACASAFGQAISYERAEGLEGGNIVADGATTTKFFLRYTSDGVNVWTGLTNGFRIWSPEGAEWTVTVPEHLFGWPDVIFLFDLSNAPTPRNVDGVASDTVGFGFVVGSAGTGLPIDWDDETVTIEIGPIDASHNGKTLCVDSAFYPPTGHWKWARPGGDANPTWSGQICFDIGSGSDVNELGGDLPTTFELGQNYPNPFNPTTDLKFDVPTRSHVKIEVYNVLGRKVKTLVDKELEAKSYVADWDGTSDGGVSVASGIYFYRMEAGSYTATKKMMLLK